jgi:hypothetical protein
VGNNHSELMYDRFGKCCVVMDSNRESVLYMDNNREMCCNVMDNYPEIVLCARRVTRGTNIRLIHWDSS